MTDNNEVFLAQESLRKILNQDKLGKVGAGYVYVDGLSVGPMGNVVRGEVGVATVVRQLSEQRLRSGLDVQNKALSLWEEYSEDDILSLPRLSKLDGLAWDFKTTSAKYFLEVKSRNVPTSSFPTFYIRRERNQVFWNLKEVLGLSTILIIVMSDKAGFIELPSQVVRNKRPRDYDGNVIEDKDLTEDQKRNRISFFPFTEVTWFDEGLFNSYFKEV